MALLSRSILCLMQSISARLALHQPTMSSIHFLCGRHTLLFPSITKKKQFHLSTVTPSCPTSWNLLRVTSWNRFPFGCTFASSYSFWDHAVVTWSMSDIFVPFNASNFLSKSLVSTRVSHAQNSDTAKYASMSSNDSLVCRLINYWHYLNK